MAFENTKGIAWNTLIDDRGKKNSLSLFVDNKILPSMFVTNALTWWVLSIFLPLIKSTWILVTLRVIQQEDYFGLKKDLINVNKFKKDPYLP